MLSAYIEVMKNQELLKTAKKNVKIDEDILDKVQKLYDSGLTTLSEVNKIESSLALAKSNLIVQENNILDASYNLQRILGRALNPDEMSKPNDIINLPSTKEEAILFAMKNNPSLLVSQYNVKLAQATYKKKKSPFYPQIDIELSQSMNKNLSAIRGEDDRFRAMVYLSYNIFNGFADKTAIQKSISGIHQEVQIKETLKRKVIEALSLAWAANKKLNEQLKYLIEYKDFSFKTLKLYTKEYDLGRRSLLDLLSAQNDFIRAKEQIITTEYSLLFAKYRILDAMGILVSTIMEGKKIIYNNVNISQQIPQSKDILPIRYDRDKDLIVDEMDICSNSLTTQMKNIYGCELIDDNISQIQRYDEFLFEKEGMKKKSKIKLQNLIKQLSEHNIKNMKFEIVANAQYKDKTKKELFELSKKRAEVIKNEFLKAGVPADKIKTYANADDAPLYSDYDARNNRVDIIVKKLK
jgi:adhesin transport system outer membrane protein